MSFLTFDHAADDGAAHRNEINRRDITYWLEQNGYPDTIRLLCWNCNCGRQINGGVCPHQRNHHP